MRSCIGCGLPDASAEGLALASGPNEFVPVCEGGPDSPKCYRLGSILPPVRPGGLTAKGYHFASAQIDAIMDGGLDELMDALATADQAEKLKNSQN